MQGIDHKTHFHLIFPQNVTGFYRDVEGKRVVYSKDDALKYLASQEDSKITKLTSLDGQTVLYRQCDKINKYPECIIREGDELVLIQTIKKPSKTIVKKQVLDIGLFGGCSKFNRILSILPDGKTCSSYYSHLSRSCIKPAGGDNPVSVRGNLFDNWDLVWPDRELTKRRAGRVLSPTFYNHAEKKEVRHTKKLLKLRAMIEEFAIGIANNSKGCERPVLRRIGGVLFNMAKKIIK